MCASHRPADSTYLPVDIQARSADLCLILEPLPHELLGKLPGFGKGFFSTLQQDAEGLRLLVQDFAISLGAPQVPPRSPARVAGTQSGEG